MDNEALKFLGRAAIENSRIVSSCDLHEIAISEFQAQGRFYIDPESGLGWALVPWEISTKKDRAREADYFSRNNAMV